jgi:cation diffusion facilitator CzcD-associated flavoprotein CzcO
MAEHEHHRVVVVGSGFAGIGASVALQDAGVEHVVLERAQDVGGTWRDNRYPGCRCDVPSHLYSFSFALNPEWSETYSPQPEIQTYLRRVAEERGVVGRTRFGAALQEARWDGDARRWSLDTATGPMTCDVLLLGNGPLAEPATPDIPGIESFAGTTFHSASWPEGIDLTGKRVAVIGTGSSAIQFVPEIQPVVGHLTVFQRTPAWVIPHRTRRISDRERRLYRRVPAAQRALRSAIYWSRELIALGMVNNRTTAIEKLARKHLSEQVTDPELKAKLTPDFKPGCKRLLLSDTWYPALQQDNVELVTEKVVEVRPDAVVTADGVAHEVDVLILGTGFRVLDNPTYERLRGTDGRTMAEHWQEVGTQARYGATVPGFPNLFQLAGPNTGIGHTSLVVMIEAQLRYVLDALRVMDETGARSVELRPTALADWTDEMRRRSRKTVWASGGCASWYLDAEGRNGAIWPGQTFEFVRRTRRFDVERYELVGAP